MANSKISIKDSQVFSDTVRKYLEEYNKDVLIVTQQTIDEVSKDAVKTLKKNSPKGKSGRYGKGWAVKKGSVKRAQEYEVTIHNKNKPGVAHLLENPHNKVDRSHRNHGKTEPQVHILPVDEWVEQELPKRISQKIQ